MGGGGGGWHGIGIGGIGHSNSKANVVINPRVVDVDTGEILAVADGTGQSSRSSHLAAGRRRQLARLWRRKRGLRLQQLPEHHHRRGHQGRSRQAHRQPARRASKVTVRTIKVDGLVAAVDGGQIVLNVGAKAGVKVGDQLEVLRVTKEIKDPSTGAVIRRLTTTIGVIQATDVDDASSVCTPVSGSGFQEGDRVRSTAQ